jgi:5-methylcytosine-specific restriction endonuclease McrA
MKTRVNGPENKATLARDRRNARAERFLALCPLFLINGVGLGALHARRLRRSGMDAPLSPPSARIRNAIASLARHITEVRDASTCALCTPRSGTRLEAHHIVPVEEDWRRVGDPTNLITLCHSCHLDRAHAGSWFTLDPILQEALHRHAAQRETALATPQGILMVVQNRLAILGRELGRS